MVRIGTVTNVFPEGRATVYFEDTKNTSLPLPIVAVNNEYILPEVGDRVITLHLDNSSTKGFVLSSYFDGGGFAAPEGVDFQKIISGNVTILSKEGSYEISSSKIVFKTAKHEIDLDDLIDRIEALEG